MISVSVLKGREERKNALLLIFSFIFITVLIELSLLSFDFTNDISCRWEARDDTKQKVKQTLSLNA